MYTTIFLFFAYAMQFTWALNRCANFEYCSLAEFRRDLVPGYPVYIYAKKLFNRLK